MPTFTRKIHLPYDTTWLIDCVSASVADMTPSLFGTFIASIAVYAGLIPVPEV